MVRWVCHFVRSPGPSCVNEELTCLENRYHISQEFPTYLSFLKAPLLLCRNLVQL